MLPPRDRVDQGAMAMKGCSEFPKAPLSLEPHHQIFQCQILDTHCPGWGSYPSTEVKSVFSTTPADWAIFCRDLSSHVFNFTIRNDIDVFYRKDWLNHENWFKRIGLGNLFILYAIEFHRWWKTWRSLNVGYVNPCKTINIFLNRNSVQTSEVLNE